MFYMKLYVCGLDILKTFCHWITVCFEKQIGI